MRRREFITVLGGAAASWPLAARAQPAGPVRLIGVLMDYAENDPASQSLVAVFRDELAKLGWKEGGNLRIEVRWSAGGPDRVRAFAKELVNLRPDALLGRGTPETIALARETRTIPIVFAAVSDPIGSGFVASLTHPGRLVARSPQSGLGPHDRIRRPRTASVRGRRPARPAIACSRVAEYPRL